MARSKIHAVGAVVLCLSISFVAPVDFAQNARESETQLVVELDDRNCAALPTAQQSWLGPDWAPFKRFVKSCAVKRSKTVVLYVVSVWVDDYYAAMDPGAPAVKFPKPALVAPDGKTLGTLPMDYPRDPPRSLYLSFAQWSYGFPHEVRLWVDDPTLLGSRSLPSLEWDPKIAAFVQSNTNEEPRHARSKH